MIERDARVDGVDLVATVATVREDTEDARKVRKEVHLANSLLHSVGAWEEAAEALLNHNVTLDTTSQRDSNSRGPPSR